MSNALSSFWGICAISAAILACIESNSEATLIAAILFVFDPWSSRTPLHRVLIIFASIATVYVGSAIIPITLLLWSSGKRSSITGIIVASFCIIGALTQPKITSMVSSLNFDIHSGSFSFLIIPSFVIAIIGRGFLPRSSRIFTLIWPILIYVVALISLIGGWWFQGIITNNWGRILMVCAPAFLALLSDRQLTAIKHPLPNTQIILMTSLITAILTTLIIPSRPITSVVFDESHGPWETVQSTFTPDDFGRDHTYTYSLLKEYSNTLVNNTDMYDGTQQLTLPKNAIFIVKMPTKPLETKFVDYLYRWTHDGGRLLVILDHTDLYDTTQNVNPLLSHIGDIKIATDAVFDKNGMPNKPHTHFLQRFFGRIDSNMTIPYLTGASFEKFPWTARTLATYGLSYAEHGDYSNANRFGLFNPRPQNRYAEHPSIMASPVGKGMLIIMTDSTLWSNFAMFIRPYRDLFRAILGVFESPLALYSINIALFILLICAVLLLRFPKKPLLLIIGVMIGLIYGSSLIVSKSLFSPPTFNRDFGLRVILGVDAKLEFLPQLIRVNEKNYARIISSLSKYGFSPMAELPGADLPPLNTSRYWLFIQPDIAQLPKPQSIRDEIRQNKNITFLFDNKNTQQAQFKKWLNDLNLQIKEVSTLALAENLLLGLPKGESSVMLRDTRVISEKTPDSLWIPLVSNPLSQSYTSDYNKGVLTISFSADQFSDSSTGDVWEGKQSSSITRLRERQIASMIKGQNIDLWPSEAVISNPECIPLALKHYAVLENGNPILSGQLKDSDKSYLSNLQLRAINLIKKHCQDDSHEGRCQTRLIGPDLIEWMVGYSKKDGDISHIELLHDRNFSGLQSTYNIIFY